MPRAPLSLLHLQPETRAASTINHLAERRQLDQLGRTKTGELKTDLCEAASGREPGGGAGRRVDGNEALTEEKAARRAAGGFSSFN